MLDGFRGEEMDGLLRFGELNAQIGKRLLQPVEPLIHFGAELLQFRSEFGSKLIGHILDFSPELVGGIRDFGSKLVAHLVDLDAMSLENNVNASTTSFGIVSHSILVPLLPF